jgi:hypothetical protein
MARRQTNSNREIQTENKDSVFLIYTLIRESIASQQTQKSSLESKASTLIAFAGGMFALLMGARETILLFPNSSQTLILIGITLFAISIIFANLVTWVRKYRVDPDPENLANHYLGIPERETQLQIISNLIARWQDNHAKLERVAFFLNLTFGVQALAFILLGIAFLLSV